MPLRWRLALLDLGTATVGWFMAADVTRRLGSADPTPHWFAWSVVAMLSTLSFMFHYDLYLSRACTVRAREVHAIGKSVLGAAATLLVAERLIDGTLITRDLCVGVVCAFATVTMGRAVFRAWIRNRRREGWFTRPIVLVGDDADAMQIVQLIRDHPEQGFRVSGYVGDPAHSDKLQLPCIGTMHSAVSAVLMSGAMGVIIVPSSIDPALLNTTVRRLLSSGVHVQLSSGLRGIAQHRFRPTPLAYEPLFYVEPITFRPLQAVTKRLIDIVGSIAASLIALPALLIAALCIKLDDGGPLLFRQQRVGRDNRLFTLYKLRTMIPDAERSQGRVSRTHANDRRGGPLFKLSDDPRVTRVGRLLRATSIDELPQLFNVLNGSMSLVGPRPALPDEVERFDLRLRDRSVVPPGITGLWQIEARDNPSFGPYRRLDLYYIENWSPMLDLEIIALTLTHIVARTTEVVRARRRRPSTSERERMDPDRTEPEEIVLD